MNFSRLIFAWDISLELCQFHSNLLCDFGIILGVAPIWYQSNFMLHQKLLGEVFHLKGNCPFCMEFWVTKLCNNYVVLYDMIAASFVISFTGNLRGCFTHDIYWGKLPPLLYRDQIGFANLSIWGSNNEQFNIYHCWEDAPYSQTKCSEPEANCLHHRGNQFYQSLSPTKISSINLLLLQGKNSNKIKHGTLFSQAVDWISVELLAS